MNNITSMFVLLLVLLLMLLATLVITKSGAGLPVRARRLMTERERRVFTLIEAAAPGCGVHAQVAMRALIDVKPGVARSTRASSRNRFNRKIVHYVLEQRDTGEVAALVELDDKTRSAGKDAPRDRLTAAAGYVTVRLGQGEQITPELVAQRIAAALHGAALVDGGQAAHRSRA